MENDILGQVIEVEKEIQKCLELEKTAAREWLESVKKECEEESVREGQKIKESLLRSIDSVSKDAGVKAAEVVKQAAGDVERLGKLDAAVLARIVSKQIGRILPE